MLTDLMCFGRRYFLFRSSSSTYSSSSVSYLLLVCSYSPQSGITEGFSTVENKADVASACDLHPAAGNIMYCCSEVQEYAAPYRRMRELSNAYYARYDCGFLSVFTCSFCVLLCATIVIHVETLGQHLCDSFVLTYGRFYLLILLLSASAKQQLELPPVPPNSIPSDTDEFTTIVLDNLFAALEVRLCLCGQCFFLYYACLSPILQVGSSIDVHIFLTSITT